MLFADELSEIANEEAARLQAEQFAIDQENLELDRQKLNNDLKSLQISNSLQFKSEFVPLLGGEYFCPICQVRSGQKFILIPTSSPDGGDLDAFSCKGCGHEFVTQS